MKEKSKNLNFNESKDYSNVKLSDIYQPREGALVVEKPPLMSDILKIVKIDKDEKKIKDMDMVFTVVAVGEGVTNYKVGDKVLVNGTATPVNLMDPDSHLQIEEYQVMGKVTTSEYKEIKEFFRKKNEVIAPVITKPYLSGDGKNMFN